MWVVCSKLDSVTRDRRVAACATTREGEVKRHTLLVRENGRETRLAAYPPHFQLRIGICLSEEKMRKRLVPSRLCTPANTPRLLLSWSSR